MRFAEDAGSTDHMLRRWEYGRRGISSTRAAELARKLGLPAWHFEQALALDRMAEACRLAELTTVVVGLELYVTTRLPGAEWAAVRAKLLEGM